MKSKTVQKKKTPRVTNAAAGQVRRFQLFGADGRPLRYREPKMEEPPPKAFHDKAFFNEIIKFIGQEGPAFSKVAFMIGTAAETAYAGWTAGHITGEFVWLITLMVWGMGLMYETAFGYAWYMTGSDKVAGDQVKLVESMYKRCLFFMSGGLIAALASFLFAEQAILNIWLLVQVLGAVSILRLQRRIKAAHPEEIARQRGIDRKAKWNAAWMDEAGKEQDLVLEHTAHARYVERRQLAIKQSEDLRVLESNAYRDKARSESEVKLLGKARSPGDDADGAQVAKGEGGEQELKPIAYPCIWCGKPLEGKQKRYHPECRVKANKERERKGTEATGNKRVCAETGCSKPARKGGRYCSDACKMKAYRARKKRKR